MDNTENYKYETLKIISMLFFLCAVFFIFVMPMIVYMDEIGWRMFIGPDPEPSPYYTTKIYIVVAIGIVLSIVSIVLGVFASKARPAKKAFTKLTVIRRLLEILVVGVISIFIALTLFAILFNLQ